jgi:hypothetical protein
MNFKNTTTTATKVLSQLKQAWTRIGQLPQLITFFVLGLLPSWAQASILSQGICRPYRKLVDNELFLMVCVISATILLIAWKLAPSGSALAKGVGLLAGLVIGVNIENILQYVTGSGLAC